MWGVLFLLGGIQWTIPPHPQECVGSNGKYTEYILCRNEINSWDTNTCRDKINRRYTNPCNNGSGILIIQSGTDGDGDKSLKKIYCGNSPNNIDCAYVFFGIII